MRREVVKAVGWGVLFTAILTLLIIVGSRNLSRFDAALVAYTFASLFAVFGITYRYAMWLQRPPTRCIGSVAGKFSSGEGTSPRTFARGSSG